jgi:ubiquinol-cytochrome c reductase cytochrome c1 subunit
MIARLFATVTLLAASQSFAAGGAALDHVEFDPGNKASLQRGARNFMNYCSGCHSAKYVRFNTIGKYLDLSEEQLIDNLMFNAEKTFETINTAMPASSAARWFGTPPPDMSLMARSKGADYIYSFLRGFYLSPGSPTGVDNRVLAGTSMPHVLWELQGYQKGLFSEHTEEGVTTHSFDGFELVIDGSMDSEDFDNFVADTVNFLAYIAEPVRSERRKLGVWVLMFLIFFWILSVMLKKQIWKDVK